MSRIKNTLIFICELAIVSLAPSAYSVEHVEDRDIILPEIVAVSGDATVVYGKGFPGTVTRTITSANKTALYYASLRILNPTKKTYEIKIECIDEIGNPVIEGVVQRELFPVTESKYLESKSGYVEVTMGLNPKPGAMVPGQHKALKNGEGYFVRLYVENKLIGLSHFRYVILIKP